MRHPHVLQLIMDSLRYWVSEMHVDGFRFDLAATLARELHDVDTLSSFFDLIQQDPVRQPGQAHRRAVGRRRGRVPGRQLPAAVVGVERQVPRRRCATSGAAPSRDRGRVRLPLHRAARTSTSRAAAGRRQHQLHHRPRRLHAARPRLLQREAQRGERRGQPRRHRRQPLVELRGGGADRRPGDPRAARAGSERNLLATLLLSQGVPCCSAATRWAAPSSGNNNAYCQDNEISWFDWEAGTTTCSSSRGCCRLRREHPVFRRRRWFQGRPIMAETSTTSSGSRPTAEPCPRTTGRTARRFRSPCS